MADVVEIDDTPQLFLSDLLPGDFFIDLEDAIVAEYTSRVYRLQNDGTVIPYAIRVSEDGVELVCCRDEGDLYVCHVDSEEDNPPVFRVCREGEDTLP